MPSQTPLLQSHLWLTLPKAKPILVAASLHQQVGRLTLAIPFLLHLLPTS